MNLFVFLFLCWISMIIFIILSKTLYFHQNLHIFLFLEWYFLVLLFLSTFKVKWINHLSWNNYSVYPKLHLLKWRRKVGSSRLAKLLQVHLLFLNFIMHQMEWLMWKNRTISIDSNVLSIRTVTSKDNAWLVFMLNLIIYRARISGLFSSPKETQLNKLYILGITLKVWIKLALNTNKK